MSRWLRPAVAALVVVAVAWFALLFSEAGGGAPLVVIEAEGDVRVEAEDGSARVASLGSRLVMAERLITGASSSAVIATGEASRLRVGPETRLRVVHGDAAEVSFELEEGRVEATVRPGDAGVRIGRSGRAFVVRDGGFAMGVGPEGTIAIEVAEGQVRAEGAVAQVEPLTAGQRAVVGVEGEVDVEPVSANLLLAVRWPQQQRRKEDWTLVVGRTVAGGRVRVRGGREEVETIASADGEFSVRVPLVDGANRLAVHAVDPLGRSTEVSEWTLDVDRSGPTFRGGVGEEPGSLR